MLHLTVVTSMSAPALLQLVVECLYPESVQRLRRADSAFSLAGLPSRAAQLSKAEASMSVREASTPTEIWWCARVMLLFCKAA